MKKIILLIMIISIIFMNPFCVYLPLVSADTLGNTTTDNVTFRNLSDPKLHQYIEDSIYAEMDSEFSSEDYIIEDIRTQYISKEYLEEIAYNSQSNIFFGYTLSELDEQFQGKKYVFTLGDDGQTVVKEMDILGEDVYDKVIRNVAIGTGVILICVTVSVVTGGAGLVPVSMFFAASAKTAATMAVSSSIIGGVSAGITEGILTNDFDVALEAAALKGSEGFKWGAISGAIIGGFDELNKINRASKAVEGAKEYVKGSVEIPENINRWRQAELRALNEYGGYEQLSYLNGKLVSSVTPNATKPDVIRYLGDHIEAIEVKCYDLERPSHVRAMLKALSNQISNRVKNLPKGSTQKIMLDVTGRGYSKDICNNAVKLIRDSLDSIYFNIPIEIVGF